MIKLTERIVDTEVETTVDDDTNDGGDEATVETRKTVRRKGLLVDVNETVELTLSSTLGRLGVVGETSTGVVKGVDEEKGRGTSSTTGSDVASKPLPVALALLEAEQRLEVVLCNMTSEDGQKRYPQRLTEGEVQGLRREVPDDVGGVTTPEGDETLITVGTREAVNDALVGGSQTTLLDLYATSRLANLLKVIARREHTISSWFCTKSLIRSMGAADVLATA